MKCWLATAIALGIGCTVPETDQVLLERFCEGRGPQALDGVLRADPSACDRGLELTLQPVGFNPGCIRVTLRTQDGTRTVSTLVLGRQEAQPGEPLRVAVLLADTWRGDVLFHVDAFEQTCDTAPVASQVLPAVPTDKGQVAQARLDLTAEDLDQDGFVSAARGGTDCDDANAAIHPGAVERCNGVDDNCVDGERDAVDAPTWYADTDLDGHGGTPVRACVAPAGAYAVRDDCDDRNRLVHPGQAESLCDGKDDNCDGDVDEGFNVGAACTTAQYLPGRLNCDAAVPTRTVCTAIPSVTGTDSSEVVE
ncbi:hypothetical protein D7X30_13505 [Corallococcus sp. AB011P]|nr:hypothetical protein D7X30_13505 [Corallococcus sp. AB011P]